METMKLVLPLNEELTAIRRHIHQHPEDVYKRQPSFRPFWM